MSVQNRKEQEISLMKIGLISVLIFIVIFFIFVFVRKQTKQYTMIEIPTISQHEAGYPRGCEGVSLYMILKGKGYVDDVSLEEFMDSMPLATEESDFCPETGYAGDPTQSLESEVNMGKRTTINPKPLTEWAKQYGANAVNMEGASPEKLRKVLKAGAPMVVWITNGYDEPEWGEWSWGKAVTNNHAVCLVGYDEKNEEYIINDTGGIPVAGVYALDKEEFENSYNCRKFAVAIY